MEIQSELFDVAEFKRVIVRHGLRLCVVLYVMTILATHRVLLILPIKTSLSSSIRKGMVCRELEVDKCHIFGSVYCSYSCYIERRNGECISVRIYLNTCCCIRYII